MANGDVVSNLGIGKRRKKRMDEAIDAASRGNQPRTLRRQAMKTRPEPRIVDIEAANRSTRQKEAAQRERIRKQRQRKGLRRKSFGMGMSSGPILKGGNLFQ